MAFAAATSGGVGRARRASLERPPEVSNRLGREWCLVIVSLALGYRTLCFFSISPDVLLQSPVVDASYHDQWAQRIAAGNLIGHGPDDVFKPPIYPYFLGRLYAVFGRSLSLVQWVQYVSGTLSCLMAAALAARFLDRRTGAAVGILSALYAPYVFFRITTADNGFEHLSESLFRSALAGLG